MISDFRFDINQDGAADIVTSSDLPEDDSGTISYQDFRFMLKNGLHLLAHGNMNVAGKDKRGVVSVVKKGEEINRGLEEVLYPEDYYYGDNLLAVSAQLNSDADIPVMFEGPIAGEKGYIALYMMQSDGLRFGWIEFECSSEAMWTTRPEGHIDGQVVLDTEFKVTDAYLSPEPNKGVVAGVKG
jgi:hypothetical protein